MNIAAFASLSRVRSSLARHCRAAMLRGWQHGYKSVRKLGYIMADQLDAL